MSVAVEKQNVKIVKKLLKMPGINVGETIFLAIKKENIEIIELLLSHPNINIHQLKIKN